MNESRPELLVILSAPAAISRKKLTKILAEHDNARITVYLRIADLDEYQDLVTDLYVCSDKPVQSKGRFLSELRTTLYSEAIVLDFGQWSFFAARCLFFLARAQVKTVWTERGSFEFSPWSPFAFLDHWLYRCRHRSGSVAGLPPGTPVPFLLAGYRKTLGLVFGLAWTMLRYGWRRVSKTTA